MRKSMGRGWGRMKPATAMLFVFLREWGRYVMVSLLLECWRWRDRPWATTLEGSRTSHFSFLRCNYFHFFSLSSDREEKKHWSLSSPRNPCIQWPTSNQTSRGTANNNFLVHVSRLERRTVTHYQRNWREHELYLLEHPIFHESKPRLQNSLRGFCDHFFNKIKILVLENQCGRCAVSWTTLLSILESANIDQVRKDVSPYKYWTTHPHNSTCLTCCFRRTMYVWWAASLVRLLDHPYSSFPFFRAMLPHVDVTDVQLLKQPNWQPS